MTVTQLPWLSLLTTPVQEQSTWMTWDRSVSWTPCFKMWQPAICSLICEREGSLQSKRSFALCYGCHCSRPCFNTWCDSSLNWSKCDQGMMSCDSLQHLTLGWHSPFHGQVFVTLLLAFVLSLNAYICRGRQLVWLLKAWPIKVCPVFCFCQQLRWTSSLSVISSVRYIYTLSLSSSWVS